MASQLQANGGQPQKAVRSATLYTGRMFQGLYTNRSPLRMGGMTWIYEKFYGGQNDALINGLNTEISNRLTLVRRFGNPVYTNPTTGVVSAVFDGVDRFESFHLLGPTTEDIDVMIDTVGTAGGDQPTLWTGLDATGVTGVFPGGSKKALVFQKTVPQQAFMESVGNVLFFGDGAEQRKWLETVTTWASITSAALSLGQYPYFTTYIIDSNLNMQQLIATVLTLSDTLADVEVAPDGITVTLKLVPGQVLSTNLVASGVGNPITSGTPMLLQGFALVTQLNGAFGYVTSIFGDSIIVTLTTKVAPEPTTTDVGLAIVVDGGTPTKGATEPVWATHVLVPEAVWPYPADILTVDGTALWINRSAPNFAGTVPAIQAAGIFNWGININGLKSPFSTSTTILPAPQPNPGSGAFAANTFYALNAVIIDSNGNLQLVTTAGTGGATVPTWQTSVGLVTTATGGTAQWTMIQTAASLTWAAHTPYEPENVLPITGNPVYGTGQFLVQTAAGVPCLFQLQPATLPQLAQQGTSPQANMVTGDYVDLWYYAGDGHFGLFKPTPATTGGATASAKVNSLLFNVPDTNDPNEQPMVNFTLNQAGELSGPTTPYAGATSNYSMVALFSVVIDQAFMNATSGQCQLYIGHDDGMVLGCAQSGVTWAASQNLNGQIVSALNGYALIGGDNVNGAIATQGVITFPAAGKYDFEINYFQNINEQTLVVQMNGYTPAPTLGPYTVTSVATHVGATSVYTGTFPAGVTTAVGQTFNISGFTDVGNNGYFKCTVATPTALTLTNPNGTFEAAAALATCTSVESMTTAPTWPAWGVGSAPAYPAVTEQSTYPGNGFGPYSPTGGYLTWNNIGPAANYVWLPNENFVLSDDLIVDVNGNLESPYSAGYSGATPPSPFSLLLNGLTNTSSSLIFINQGPQPSTTGSSLLTTAIGWRYGIALVNTLDNTVSNMTQLSASTGPFTNVTYIQLPPGYGLPPIAQIDPQADYVAIFRTTDGGATPLLIPGVGNSIYTLPLNEYLADGYQDTTPDTGLNVEIQGAAAGENTPPALGAINLVYHLSRIFYSIGNVVYWTTGPAAPIGNGLNGASPLNFTQMPSLVKRMFPTSIGLLVFTISDVYIIPGQGTTSNPIQPGQPYLPGVGLLSYNEFDNCGTIIGLLTTDGTQMSIDPGGGFLDSGQPIGNNFGLRNTNVLGQNWNPAIGYITWYVNGEDQAWYVADGETGWYRLCATPSPETGYSWSPFAQIEGGTHTAPTIKAVQSIEVQPGIRRLLIGPYGVGQILNRASLQNPSFTDAGQVGIVNPLHLASAANFDILASSTVTSSGFSVISGGDLGLYPGTSVVGFPPGVVVPPNVQHITDVVAQQGQVDLSAALVYYSGLTFTSLGASSVDLSTSGNGSGPNVYNAGNYSAGTSMDIPTSIVLDAQGDANAIFVFKAGSSVTLESGASVTLANGAQAGNVYWVVGSSFVSVFAGTSNMVGTIMAVTSITLGGGNLNGRALASTGAVTLSTAVTITYPTLTNPATLSGLAYRAFGDIGSLVLVNPGQVAAVNFVTTECVRIGTPLTLGLLLDEAEPYTSVPFDILRNWVSDPTNQPASRSILSQRFYVSDDEDADALCRHMQLRVDWGFDTVQNELLTYSVIGAFFQET